ncbi:MAG: type III PLP-dependent enzyme [Acidaminococcales bacterium]|jgi:ornithine decarboxylase|nr:type III PLP-dependent enzyme [Acidaminococcales bacterium]
MKNSNYFRLTQNAVKQLADVYDTPFLVLSLEQIENNYRLLQKYMPQVKIHYAVKANPDKNIVAAINRLGGCFDVASGGEITELAALNIASDRMLYANPFKTDAGLKACRRYGVNKFTLDSRTEIDKLAQCFPGAGVLLRLRIDNTGAVVDLNKKFGARPEQILPLLKYAAAAGLNVLGLCFHVGSQTLSAAPYIRALKKSRELFDAARLEGYHLKTLDIGGGYPVPSMIDDVDIAGLLTKINECLENLFPDTEIWSEPGRFVCATAVNMLTKVIGVTERNGQPWYFLDEGVYGAFSGVLFDHWDYEFVSYKNGPGLLSTFAGPSCDSLDVICCGRASPPLLPNDILLVPACGAYSSASATSFNGFAKAQTIVWEEAREKLSLAEFCFAPAV